MRRIKWILIVSFIGTLSSFVTKSWVADREIDTNDAFFVYSPTALMHFDIDSIPKFDNLYKVSVQIKNDKLDTLSFHSTSCNGELDLLVYDTTQVTFERLIHCNASFPRIITLAPGETHQFVVYARMKELNTNIRLGFKLLESYSRIPAKSLEEIEEMKKKWSGRLIIWGSSRY